MAHPTRARAGSPRALLVSSSLALALAAATWYALSGEEPALELFPARATAGESNGPADGASDEVVLVTPAPAPEPTQSGTRAPAPEPPPPAPPPPPPLSLLFPGGGSPMRAAILDGSAEDAVRLGFERALIAPDPVTRIRAAGVIARNGDPASIPTLEALLERETNAGVLSAARQAIARLRAIESDRASAGTRER